MIHYKNKNNFILNFLTKYFYGSVILKILKINCQALYFIKIYIARE